MKYITFLPFISNSTFNKAKLTLLTSKLYLDAVNYMGKWFTVKYDNDWTIGFLSPGNIVYDYMYVQHKKRKPTRKEVVEVIDVLPYKYKYELDEDDEEENKVNVILAQ
jgi:hypothetical protein